MLEKILKDYLLIFDGSKHMSVKELHSIVKWKNIDYIIMLIHNLNDI